MKSLAKLLWILTLLVVASLLVGAAASARTQAPVAPPIRDYWQVQEPIVYSNLALFPVTASVQHNSSGYLTLEEGLRSGEVEVTELGAPLVRRRPGLPPDAPRVNTLSLVNHSKKPLVLLAGEVVTGGKQDRVIARDRIVPPGNSLPLDVFCVEPGRWAGASGVFAKSLMAAPRVREKAAVARDQQQVWAETQAARESVAEAAGAVAAPELRTSTSYAQLENSPAVKRALDDASGALQRDYERALGGALRGKRVVGVVVAINGEVVWADLFADAALFERYWPKLLRSYTVEAMSVPVVEHARAAVADAERFLAEQSGKQVIEVEPGEYRLVEIQHARYTIFQLTSLFEKIQPLMHWSKLRREMVIHGRKPIPMPGPYRPQRED